MNYCMTVTRWIVVALVLIPFKLLGGLASGVFALFGVLFKLALAAVVIVVALIGIAALPVILPLAVASGVAVALLC